VIDEFAPQFFGWSLYVQFNF